MPEACQPKGSGRSQALRKNLAWHLLAGTLSSGPLTLPCPTYCVLQRKPTTRLLLICYNLPVKPVSCVVCITEEDELLDEHPRYAGTGVNEFLQHVAGCQLLL